MKPIAFNYENFSALQEENLYLAKSVAELARESVEREKTLAKLESEVMAGLHRADAARNELCLKCGRYHDAHNGACDGCRWKGAGDERR